MGDGEWSSKSGNASGAPKRGMASIEQVLKRWLKDNKVDLAIGVMVNPGSQPTIKEAVRLGMGVGMEYEITIAFSNRPRADMQLLRRYAEHIQDANYRARAGADLITRTCPACEGTRLRPESRLVQQPLWPAHEPVAAPAGDADPLARRLVRQFRDVVHRRRAQFLGEPVQRVAGQVVADRLVLARQPLGVRPFGHVGQRDRRRRLRLQVEQPHLPRFQFRAPRVRRRDQHVQVRRQGGARVAEAVHRAAVDQRLDDPLVDAPQVDARQEVRHVQERLLAPRRENVFKICT